jgi:hypothetical protein
LFPLISFLILKSIRIPGTTILYIGKVKRFVK